MFSKKCNHLKNIETNMFLMAYVWLIVDYGKGGEDEESKKVK